MKTIGINCLIALVLFSCCGLVFADSLNVRSVGHCLNPSSAKRVFVLGDYAYVADGGLHIINVINQANPVQIGYYSSSSNDCYDVKVTGSYAYMADFNYGLYIVDVSNPSNPIGIDSCPIYGAKGISVAGNDAYVVSESQGFKIIDVRDPMAPVEVGSCAVDGEDVFVTGNYAYTAEYNNGLNIIDVSDSANPTLVGHYTTPSGAASVVISGNYAYVAVQYSGLWIFDISDPASPLYKGRYSNTGYNTDVAISGNYAYTTHGAVIGLIIVDIQNPASPAMFGFYDTPGFAQDVYVYGNYIYVADYSSGLQIYEFTGTGVTGNPEVLVKKAAIGIEAFPNPFKMKGTLRYQLASGSECEIKIYNINGRMVRSFHQGYKAEGVYTIEWNGCDNVGRPVPSGVYFARVGGNAGRKTCKLTLVR